MPRGRPRNSAKKDNGASESIKDGPAPKDHNKPSVAKDPLTDAQRQSLFFNHVNSYEKGLAVKKAADADLKVICKRIKAEGTKLDDVKTAIMLQKDGGEAELRDEINRKIQVAKWLSLPIGTQLSLLEEVDRTPILERTFDDGKRAGLRGEAASPPTHLVGELMQQWLRGHGEGQNVIMGKFKQKEPEADHAAQRATDAAEFEHAEAE